MKDDRVYLLHVRDAIEAITSYTAAGRDACLADRKTQDAVIRNLEVIGQAVKVLGTDALGTRNASVPWEAVAGLRNVLAHQYLGVDINLVWRIVERDLPSLKGAVESVLSDMQRLRSD